jgi:hypothetical protein
VPFLAVCPACRRAQVCFLPASSFPRLKCGRCRRVFDPIGSADTEVIPALAGEAGAHRAKRARKAKAVRFRRRRARRRQPTGEPPSVEAVAAAVLAEPMPEPEAPAAETEQPAMAPTVPAPARAPVRRTRTPPPVSTPLALAGLFVLGLAGLAAAVAAVRFLAGPLSVAGLLAGGWAVRRAVRDGSSVGYPVAVTTLGALAVAAAFLVPTWLADRRLPDWADGDVQVIPLPQFAGDPAVRAAEWVDAGKATIQQGAVRLEVVGARIDHPPGGPAALLVRVRLHTPRGLPGPDVRWDRSPARLWDADGGPCPSTADPVANGSDTVFAFAVPATMSPHLRLELPAAAWAGSGSFKFAIPVGMVRR